MTHPAKPQDTSIFAATPLVQKFLVPNKDDTWAKTVLKIVAFIPGILPLLIVDGIKAIITYLKSEPAEDQANPAKPNILKRAWHKIVEHKGKTAILADLALAIGAAYYFRADLPELPTEGKLAWVNPWTYTCPQYVIDATNWAKEQTIATKDWAASFISKPESSWWN